MRKRKNNALVIKKIFIAAAFSVTCLGMINSERAYAEESETTKEYESYTPYDFDNYIVQDLVTVKGEQEVDLNFNINSDEKGSLMVYFFKTGTNSVYTSLYNYSGTGSSFANFSVPVGSYTIRCAKIDSDINDVNVNSYISPDYVDLLNTLDLYPETVEVVISNNNDYFSIAVKSNENYMNEVVSKMCNYVFGDLSAPYSQLDYLLHSGKYVLMYTNDELKEKDIYDSCKQYMNGSFDYSLLTGIYTEEQIKNIKNNQKIFTLLDAAKDSGVIKICTKEEVNSFINDIAPTNENDATNTDSSEKTSENTKGTDFTSEKKIDDSESNLETTFPQMDQTEDATSSTAKESTGSSSFFSIKLIPVILFFIISIIIIARKKIKN